MERFKADPNSGYRWGKRETYYQIGEGEVSQEKRSNLVKSIITQLTKRCCNTPAIFEESESLLDTRKWIDVEFFKSLDGQIQCTDKLDSELVALLGDASIRKQLECQNVDVNAIPSEWQSLKEKMSTWNKRATRKFPPESWEQVAEWVVVEVHFENLFALIDFFLCHSVSSADAERGFSAMKELKTSKRTRLENSLLILQLAIYIDGVDIADFKTEPAMQRWLLKPSTNSSAGTVKAKPPGFMDNQHNKHGPKKKARQDTPIFIRD